MKKVLVAGIGNIFFGDDAFGCEVIKVLQLHDLSQNIKVADFGIRTRDLAYELCENYEIIILIDAVKTEKLSGIISLFEIDPNDFTDRFQTVSHDLKLEETLNFAKTLGAKFQKIYLVGCEPETLEYLSETVKKSIAKAAKIVKNLIVEQQS